MRISNRKCRETVASLTPFNGSNLSGEIINDCHGRFYVVKSYGWYPLYVCRLNDRIWYRNTERYSVSTTRQSGDARPYNVEFRDVNFAEIKAILNGR